MPRQDNDNKVATPGTGDYDNFFVFVVLLCVSGVATMVAAKHRRRDE